MVIIIPLISKSLFIRFFKEAVPSAGNSAKKSVQCKKITMIKKISNKNTKLQ